MTTPDFDDLVFRGRNKEYGAFFLRKRYNSVMVLSVLIAVLTGTLLILIPFFKTPDIKIKEPQTSVFVTMENLKPPGPMLNPDLPPPPSVPRFKPSGSRMPEAKYVAPKVVDSIPFIEKPISEKTDSIGTNDGKGSDIGDIGEGTGDYHGGVEGGTGGGGNGLYARVDVMPLFRGGDINKFREWVQKKTKYPQTAIINEIEGKVYITFIVENDGRISNVKVAKGIDPLLDNEAINAVMSSPKWTPGRLQGIPVRVKYIIMLNFEL